MEKYIKIIGFDLYEVSNLGNVRNCKTGKILKPCVFKNSGYLYLDLCINGVKHRRLIHRIVMESFIGNIEFKQQVNHINGIKTDNRIENLEWCTRSENQKHSIDIGLRSTIGEKNSQSKITESDVILILNDNRKYSEISNEFGISVPTVSDIKRGYSWTHITGIKSKNNKNKITYETK